MRWGSPRRKVADDDADNWGDESKYREAAGRIAFQQAGEEDKAEARDDQTLIENGAQDADIELNRLCFQIVR